LSKDISQGLDAIARLTNAHLAAKGLHNAGQTHESKESASQNEESVSENETKVDQNEVKQEPVVIETMLEEQGEFAIYGRVQESVTSTEVTKNTVTSTEVTRETVTNTKVSEVTSTPSRDVNDYASLGETLVDLTAKMRAATDEVKQNSGNLPFIDASDEDDDGEDAWLTARTERRDEEEAALDAAITEATGLSPDQHVIVEQHESS